MQLSPLMISTNRARGYVQSPHKNLISNILFVACELVRSSSCNPASKFLTLPTVLVLFLSLSLSPRVLSNTTFALSCDLAGGPVSPSFYGVPTVHRPRCNNAGKESVFTFFFFTFPRFLIFFGCLSMYICMHGAREYRRFRRVSCIFAPLLFPLLRVIVFTR